LWSLNVYITSCILWPCLLRLATEHDSARHYLFFFFFFFFSVAFLLALF
jgi:hypothetical protein